MTTETENQNTGNDAAAADAATNAGATASATNNTAGAGTDTGGASGQTGGNETAGANAETAGAAGNAGTENADSKKETPVDAAGGADDWRIKMANGDEKVLKLLSRYASPAAAAKGLVDLKAELSSNKYARKLAPDASAEEVAAWRKDNGIPDTADAYQLEQEGVVISDEDKRIFKESGFLEGMHNLNASPKVVQEAAKYFFKARDQRLNEIAQADIQHNAATEEDLRNEWGVEYNANYNAVGNFLATMPDEVAANLMNTRMPNGKLFKNDPDMVRWAASTALQLNPVARVLPHTTNPGEAAKTMAAEISDLETQMGQPDSAYHKGPASKKYPGMTEAAARYRDLLEAQMANEKYG
jgi:hypothetical protein